MSLAGNLNNSYFSIQGESSERAEKDFQEEGKIHCN